MQHAMTRRSVILNMTDERAQKRVIPNARQKSQKKPTTSKNMEFHVTSIKKKISIARRSSKSVIFFSLGRIRYDVTKLFWADIYATVIRKIPQ